MGKFYGFDLKKVWLQMDKTDRIYRYFCHLSLEIGSKSKALSSLLKTVCS